MATRASGGRTDTNFQAVAKSRKISVSMRRTAPLLYRHGLKRRVTGGRAGSGIVEMRSRPIEVQMGKGNRSRTKVGVAFSGSRFGARS